MRCSLRAPCTSLHSPPHHQSLIPRCGAHGVSQDWASCSVLQLHLLVCPQGSVCVHGCMCMCARSLCTSFSQKLWREHRDCRALHLPKPFTGSASHSWFSTLLIAHTLTAAQIRGGVQLWKGGGGTSVLSKCVHGASSVCVCGRKGNRGSECRRERSSGRVLVWAREERMAAHAWTASPAQKGGKQIQQSLSNAPEERICSSFAGRQSRRKKKRFGNACWSEGGKCAVLEWLYLLPSGFFPSSSCREL